MSRTKSSISEFITQLGRSPQRERIWRRMKEILDSPAAFYGFETIHIPSVEGPAVFTSLAKADFLKESQPVFCRTSKLDEFILHPPPALAILRAYSSYKMNELPHPLKFKFCSDYCFLASGRDSGIRCRSTWGLMIIGDESVVSEAEILHVVWKALETIGDMASAVELRINAVGCGECRPVFRSSFLSYFRPRAQKVCRNCRRHLKRTPTKVLICEEEKCRAVASHVPQVLDFLCDTCKKHLRGLLEFLDEARVPYFLDPKFFREGSWYDGVIFEVVHRGGVVQEQSGMAEALIIAEGGRVSRAGEAIYGKRIDAVSITVFMDVLGKTLERKGVLFTEEAKPEVFFVQLGELAKRKSLNIIETLRKGSIVVQESLSRDSVRSQFKVAERLGAELALILGQKEALDSTIIVREMGSGIQETIPQEKLIEFLKRKLKK